jgi:putative glutamine amidotransferase
VNIVAISQRIDAIKDRNEMRDSIDQRLVEFISYAGYLAVPVPNNLQPHSNGLHGTNVLGQWLQKLSPAAIVLSGGNDLGHYMSRDITENRLLNYAIDKNIPLLGICRGMQMIANYYGVGLHPVIGHVGVRHQISGEINREVNSYHQYAIDSCPPGFTVLATDINAEIEAFRHLSKPIEGWMWHPERESDYSNHDSENLIRLFEG